MVRAKQLHALRYAKRHDRVPSWVVVRSSAVALAYGGDRDPLRTYLQHVLTTDQFELQVDDEFRERVDPQSWSGVQLLAHLSEILRPGSGQAELNLHTMWALLLTHPALLSDYPHLRSATARTIDELAVDHDLSVRAWRELSDIAYAVHLAHR